MVSVRSDLMMRAAEGGQDAINKQADRDQQESQFSREHSGRQQGRINAEFQQQQQINEQNRSNVEREKLAASELGERQRSNRMGEAIQQDAQDIDMADKGLESKGGGSRADRLRQEMDRGAAQQKDQQQAQRSPEDQAGDARYAEQAQKPLEVAGPDRRTIAPTGERVAQEASKLTTNRLNAQANFLNASRNFNEAQVKGDKEGMSAAAREMQTGVVRAASIFDAGKAGALSPEQWSKIDDLATTSVGKVPDPQLQAEIDSRTWGPALSRFMQAHIQHQNLRFISVTGDMPDGDYVDMASPEMRQFTEESAAAQQYMREADYGGILSLALNVDSLATRNQKVRKMAAQAMLQSKSIAAMLGAQAQGAGVIPSQGGQRAQPQQPQSGSATPQQIGAGAARGAAGGGAARGAANVLGAGQPPAPQLPGQPGTERDWNRDVR